jgi:hypothetical protein
MMFVLAMLAASALADAALADSNIDEAMRQATQVSPAEGRAQIDAWVAAHAGSPSVPLARYWQAQSFVRESRYDDADRVLAEIESAPTDIHWDARLMRADLQLAQRHWSKAEAAYRAVGAPGGSRWEYEANARGEIARSSARREEAVWVTLAAILALALYRGVSLRRALWPPPEELVFAAPLLAVLAIAAVPRVPEERFAVLAVALGAVPLLWVHGAYLRAHPLRPLRRVGEAVLGIAQAAGVVFCAVVVSGLWDSVVNTWMAGVE